jgi:hypothetical protein
MSFASTIAQAAAAIAPRWAVVLCTLLALLVIAIHILALANADMHPSRRRIRTANGFLMMLGVASLSYAIGVASPAHPREFALAWTIVMALMAMIVGVACIDALNSLRLHAIERRGVRRELDKARLEVLGVTARQRPQGPSRPPSGPPPSNTPA